jgi:hypothetical protein
MKKSLLTLLTALAAQLGQAQILPSSTYTIYSSQAGWYSHNNGDTDRMSGNVWADDSGTWDNNWTVSSGNGAISRGLDAISRDLTVTITNNFTGRIVQRRSNNPSQTEGLAFIQTTRIVMNDDTTFDGFAEDRNARAQRTASDAIYVNNANSSTDQDLGLYELVEGIYRATEAPSVRDGNGGFTAAYLKDFRGLNIDGASFVGADSTSSTDGLNNYGGNGLWVENAVEGIQIMRTDRRQNIFEFVGGNAGILNTESFRGSIVNGSGGEGAVLLETEANIAIYDANFYGGGNANDQSPRIINVGGFNAERNTVYGEGGTGLLIAGNDGGGSAGDVDIYNGEYRGGSAADINATGRDSMAYAFGGYGLFVGFMRTLDLSGGDFRGGTAGSITMDSSNVYDDKNGGTFMAEGNGRAYAYGGHGIYAYNIAETLTIGEETAISVTNGWTETGHSTVVSGLTASGAQGGIAFVQGSNSFADASGGHGLYATDTVVVIEAGEFSGGNGGNAKVSTEDSINQANANGGSGVYVIGDQLTINGGTFNGGDAGSATGPNAMAMAGRGIWSEGSGVTINDATGTNTVVNDGIYFENSGRALTINGGTINGEILFNGNGTSTFNASSNAVSSGTIVQNGGTVNVTLSEPGASSFFKNVQIDGKMDFGGDFTSASGSTFTLANSASEVEFNSLTLVANSRIQAGYGLVDITGGNLVAADGSNLSFSYDGLTGNNGRATVSGSLILTNENSSALISIAGAAATTNGSVQLVTAGTPTIFGANSNKVDEVVRANLGWLTKSDIDSSAGITVDFDYNSLTNSAALADFGDLLPVFDDALTSSNSIASGMFYDVNRLGEENGAKLIRYSESQLPDVADSAFQTQLQVAEQISARGTEFRSLNGFASTKPSFGAQAAPTGAAGPEADERSMQGWIRAYGAVGNRDKQGNFTDYDSTVFGSVIGIDKSFGNILIGLAGGLGVADIDASDTYQADVTTYHGSIYSTLGGESIFVDLALTYGAMNTETKNVITEDEFDSYTVSGYIGAGQSFNTGDSVKITPEASLLVSYYSQEDYNRAGLTQKTIQEYDEWSYLGALGVNMASQHQIDWLNRGFALIPEIRAHWLHEFNSDLDDFSYIIDGGGTATFGVRPRDEDLFKLGLGFDIWNWRYQHTKFEVDYDGLFSDTYTEHIFSGKITAQF